MFSVHVAHGKNTAPLRVTWEKTKTKKPPTLYPISPTLAAAASEEEAVDMLSASLAFA